MTARRSVKTEPTLPRVVGVISSRADLHRALRMRRPPDLFELRLDHLVAILDELENRISILRAPLIITARHPREGGANNLSTKKRRDLLARFLPRASFVDVELRSANALRSILELARRRNVQRIISFHDFNSTPDSRSLRAMARRARSHNADVFKVATRTDTLVQLARLLEFIASEDDYLRLSAMGIGKLGSKARRELMRRGSFLNYAHLGGVRVSGQPSLSEIRQWALAAPSIGR